MVLLAKTLVCIALINGNARKTDHPRKNSVSVQTSFWGICVRKTPGGIQGLASAYIYSHPPQFSVNIAFMTTDILITECTEPQKAAASYRLGWHFVFLSNVITQRYEKGLRCDQVLENLKAKSSHRPYIQNQKRMS